MLDKAERLDGQSPASLGLTGIPSRVASAPATRQAHRRAPTVVPRVRIPSAPAHAKKTSRAFSAGSRVFSVSTQPPSTPALSHARLGQGLLPLPSAEFSSTSLYGSISEAPSQSTRKSRQVSARSIGALTGIDERSVARPSTPLADSTDLPCIAAPKPHLHSFDRNASGSVAKRSVASWQRTAEKSAWQVLAAQLRPSCTIARLRHLRPATASPGEQDASASQCSQEAYASASTVQVCDAPEASAPLMDILSSEQRLAAAPAPVLLAEENNTPEAALFGIDSMGREVALSENLVHIRNCRVQTSHNVLVAAGVLGERQELLQVLLLSIV
jgi:hypothetical protein